MWIFALIVLKIKGDEVGCASGSAFHLVNVDDEDDLQETDSSSGDESDGNGSANHRRGADEAGQEVTLYDVGYEGEMEEMEDQSSWATEPERTRSSYPYQSKMTETPLERKTRICFLFCSIVSLLIVPFILVFSFGPMKEATEAAQKAVTVSFLSHVAICSQSLFLLTISG